MLIKNFKPYKAKLKNLIKLGYKFNNEYIIESRDINKKNFKYSILNLDYSNFERNFDIELNFND